MNLEKPAPPDSNTAFHMFYDYPVISTEQSEWRNLSKTVTIFSSHSRVVYAMLNSGLVID